MGSIRKTSKKGWLEIGFRPDVAGVGSDEG
jgi:hypothetical protein